MWNKLKRGQDYKVQRPTVEHKNFMTLYSTFVICPIEVPQFFFNTHDMLRNFHFSNHWTYSIIWPPNPSPSLKGWQVAENAVLLTRRKQEKMISYYILPGFSLYPFSIHLLNLLQCAAFFSHNSTLPSLFLKPCRDLLTPSRFHEFSKDMLHIHPHWASLCLKPRGRSQTTLTRRGRYLDGNIKGMQIFP